MVDGYVVALSAGTGTAVDSDGSYLIGSGYAIISAALLLERLKAIFDTEAPGAVPIDISTNAVNSEFDQMFSTYIPAEARHTYRRVITTRSHGSFPRIFRNPLNVSDGQLGAMSFISNRSNEDSNDATDELPEGGDYLTTQYNKPETDLRAVAVMRFTPAVDF
jgi:hypothetical protein